MKKLSLETLRQFSGTEKWYRHSLVRKVLYTDGIQYLAEYGEAYWLIDEIAFAQAKPRITVEEFQTWTLTVNEDSSASLKCDDGNKNILFIKRIPFTDFLLPEIKIYCINNVILLPSEY